MKEEQKTQRVAIQGIKGSFHHEAAGIMFGHGHEIVECMEFQDVITEVESDRASHGLMAVENSLVGGMLPNLSLIRESGLNVTGEIYMRISQNLMALPGQDIDSIREVYSHPLAIMQSYDFFSRFPHITLRESADTALSARTIAQRRLSGTAAIGSLQAAKLYGLSVISESIETNKENYTRFLLVSKQPLSLKTGRKVKASVAFVVQHSPGSLLKVIQPLAEAGINLSMLQSLPLIGQKGEYIFHADMIFDSPRQASSLIETIKPSLRKLWVMGLYPCGEGSGGVVEPGSSTDNKETVTNKTEILQSALNS